MLRGHRVFAPIGRSVLPGSHIPSMAAGNAMWVGSQGRHSTDKILVGCFSSFLSSTTTLGLFHLLVSPVSASVGAATLATAAASGALCVLDGGKEGGGTTFGAITGVIVGAMGGFYAKSQREPWRK